MSTKIRRSLSQVIIQLLLITLLSSTLAGLIPPPAAQAAPLAQAASSFTVTKLVDRTTVPSGVAFNYTLRYACNSVDTACQNVVLTDVLPAPLVFVTFVGTSHVASNSYTAATRTLVVTFVNPLPAGATGDLVVTARW